MVCAVSLGSSFMGLPDATPHPFPILCVRLSRCMRESGDRQNDTVACHRRGEDSGIEQVQAVPQTGRASGLR